METSTNTGVAGKRSVGSNLDVVDPRAPRFGQTVTALGILAGVAAAFDYCIGCRMYRQVSFFRRLGWV